MSDDLITRLRTLMAEIEARLRSPTDVGVDVGADRPLKLDTTAPTVPYTPRMAERTSARVREDTNLKDYVPSDVSYGGGFDEAVFMGTGDTYDPLHHER
jgi:hypothetical protein